MHTTIIVRPRPVSYHRRAGRLFGRYLAIAALTGVSALYAQEVTNRLAPDPVTDPSAALLAPASKPPPLPLHTIEGVGGLVITPLAYLVNPGPPGTAVSLPSLSATYINAGEKNVQSGAITETLFGRVELGYALSRFGTGSLRHNVEKATGVDIGRDDVYLHNFNLRTLLLPENSFGVPLPAVTAGVHYKYNQGIDDINDKLGGALDTIGYKKNSGVDYTLTASKTFANVFGRPLILSAGTRLSEGSQLGYVGFGNTYRLTFEGNATYLITDRIALAYEYRQKADEFGHIGDLVRSEQDWQTVGVGYVFNEHATLTAGYGRLGEVLDTTENLAWALQFKYEF